MVGDSLKSRWQRRCCGYTSIPVENCKCLAFQKAKDRQTEGVQYKWEAGDKIHNFFVYKFDVFKRGVNIFYGLISDRNKDISCDPHAFHFKALLSSPSSIQRLNNLTILP